MTRRTGVLLLSPILYGTEDVPEGLTVASAPPLVRGGEYGVELTLYAPCPEATGGCASDAATGCRTFTVPGHP